MEYQPDPNTIKRARRFSPDSNPQAHNHSDGDPDPNNPNNNNKGTNTPPPHPIFPPPHIDEDDGIHPEPIDPDLSMDSVGGLQDQVKFLRDSIIYPIKHKEQFIEWGYAPEKGVIFHGPPGTGKTLLAKAFAAEFARETNKKVTFFMRRGTDCFNKWIGETEKNIRDLFRKAKEMQPSIIFLDELDGLLPNRTDQHHAIFNSVVTTILGEIDAVPRGQVFLVGATNRLETIDPAVTRPGRFGKKLFFAPPNIAGRLQILNIHLTKWKKKPSAEDLEYISKQTSGYTGADLEQLCRHAFDTACDRTRSSQIDNNNNNGQVNISSLEVLLDDWVKAITTTQRSNSNVFGNAYFNGHELQREMEPLLGKIRNEMCEFLKRYFPQENSITDRVATTGLNIVHFWHENTTDLRIVNNHLIPSILTSILDPDKTPTFQFIPSSLASSQPIKHINDFFQQIKSCTKENIILFIPSIDKLWTYGNQLVLDCFVTNFESTRGRSIILLSTSTMELNVIAPKLPFIDSILQQACKIRQPTAAEIKEFYLPLFNIESGYYKGISQNDLDSMLADVVKIATEQKTISTMLNIQGILALAYNKAISKTTTQKRVFNLMETAVDYLKLVYGEQ